MSKGVIKKVAGPLVIAEGMRDANMFDVVRVSKERLIGEIIEMHGDQASIQVYEETAGLGPGEEVESTEAPLSVELGPGLIASIYDGIQRPLDDIMKVAGNNLKRGVEVPSLKRELKWNFVPCMNVGDEVETGDVIGTVKETEVVTQKIMIPYGIKGKIKSITAGNYTVTETVAVVETKDGDKEITLMQKWPVRKGRPYAKKLPPTKPLVTGQRVVDTLFPIARGGVAAVPGPFGSGKTVIQHQLAKWAEADIVVYIGCGERGNEMTDVLNEFPANSVAVGVPARVVGTVEDYYKKRSTKCISEALAYAKSIEERFHRKPRLDEFWEEFPLFVDKENMHLYPHLPYKRQLRDSFDYWVEHHKRIYDGFEEFLKAAGIE